MKSPLALYNEIAAEYNVTDEKKLHPRNIIAHVTAQVQEQKAIINRLIVDAAKARQDVQDAKDDTTKAAYAGNVAKFENDLRQMVKTLDFFAEFEKELTAKNPSVEVKPEDHPDGF